MKSEAKEKSTKTISGFAHVYKTMKKSEVLEVMFGKQAAVSGPLDFERKDTESFGKYIDDNYKDGHKITHK
jgi:hypothetical protein